MMRCPAVMRLCACAHVLVASRKVANVLCQYELTLRCCLSGTATAAVVALKVVIDALHDAPTLWARASRTVIVQPDSEWGPRDSVALLPVQYVALLSSEGINGTASTDCVDYIAAQHCTIALGMQTRPSSRGALP